VRRLAHDGYPVCAVYRAPRSRRPDIAATLDPLRDVAPRLVHLDADALRDSGRQRIFEVLSEAMAEGAQTSRKVGVLLHSIARGNVKAIAPQAGSKQWPTQGGSALGELREACERIEAAKANLGAGSDEASLLSPRDVDLTIQAMGSSLFTWVHELRRRQLLASDTRIIGLTSEGARRVWPGYAAVATAKSALEAIVRGLAVELGPHGVRANVVQAGVTDTESLRQIPGSELLQLQAVSRNPLGRLTTPEDVAGVVSLLCRPEAAWINGTVVIADGGEHLC
jgi:NAD(P)-dependent dehydrogenase (short-subunit alcohol dehydrogenase family)